MNENIIKKKYINKINLINHYNKKYFDENISEISDSEYDLLKNEVISLEKKYTFLSLTIERPTPELNDSLFKNGDIFVKNFKVDGFYIHKSMMKFNNIKFEKFYQIGKKEW